jgi:integrase
VGQASSSPQKSTLWTRRDPVVHPTRRDPPDRLLPVLGDVRVSRLRPSDIEKALIVWQRAGVTVWMRRKAIEVLRSALNHAVALALCEHNVARRASMPKKRQRAPSWLDVDGVKVLLDDVYDHPLELGYVLAIGLGLRRGELLGLTWGDVDLRKRMLTVNWNRVEWERGTRLMAPKTAASRRALAMQELVRAALVRQRERERKKARAAGTKLRPEDPVMTTRTRRPYWTGYLYCDLCERLARLGLPKMRLHDLRHTAASLLLSEGVPPRTVMEMMGHRNLEVTMYIYGHTNLRHQRDAVATLDRALRRYRITLYLPPAVSETQPRDRPDHPGCADTVYQLGRPAASVSLGARTVVGAKSSYLQGGAWTRIGGSHVIHHCWRRRREEAY